MTNGSWYIDFDPFWPPFWPLLTIFGQFWALPVSWEIEIIWNTNRNTMFPLTMRGLPSLKDQRFMRYEIWSFWRNLEKQAKYHKSKWLSGRSTFCVPDRPNGVFLSFIYRSNDLAVAVPPCWKLGHYPHPLIEVFYKIVLNDRKKKFESIC